MVKCSWSDSDQFWKYCSCIYVLIETADAEITASVTCAVYITLTLVKKCASAPFTQKCAEHARFIFKFTFAASYLQILVHIVIWFKCNDLLLINSSKLWQIPWHSALNCKFRFQMPDIHPSIHPSISLFFLTLYMSVCLSVCLSIYRHIRHSIYRSVILYIVLSFYLSFYQHSVYCSVILISLVLFTLSNIIILHYIAIAMFTALTM